MTGKKSIYLCAILCTIFISSILISDVNARSALRHHHTKRSHGHSGSSSHGSGHSSTSSHHSSGHSDTSSHHSSGHPGSQSSGHSSGSSVAHQKLSYPSKTGHSSSSKKSLSGNSDSSSKHNYPESHNKLSGSGNSGYVSHPSTNFRTSSGSETYGHSSSIVKPSSAAQLGSVQHPATSGTNSGSQAHGYPISQPGSLSGSGSGSSGYGYPSSNIKPVAAAQVGSASYPGNSGTNRGLGSHGYPTSRPGSLSGSGSGSSGYGYPSSNIKPSSVVQVGSAPYPGNSGTNRGLGSHGYPTSHPGSLSGSGSGSSGYGYPSSNIKPSSAVQVGSAPYPGNSGINTVSGSYAYPTSRPGSLSGGENGSPGYSYPGTTGTNSGSGAHGYPTSRPGSLSGGNGSPVYGQVGSTHNPRVNSSSGSHSYPTTRPGSLSGGGSSRERQTSSVSHPTSNVYSGNSGSSQSTGGSSHHRTVHHSSNTHHSNDQKGQKISYQNHHYYYRPPVAIRYGSYQDHAISYPVYPRTPPKYVFEYRQSGNKYRDLLTGLALYNLGRAAAHKDAYHHYRHYERRPYEYCKFGVKYRNGFSEEMAVECKSITYFIYEDEPTVYYNTTNSLNQTTVTTQMMYPNGTLVEPKNVNQNNIFNGFPNMQMPIMPPNNPVLGQQLLSRNGTLMFNANQQVLSSNGTLISNTYQQMNNGIGYSQDPISFKDPRFAGKTVRVEKDMHCYVIRHTQFNEVKKSISCELLQKYSDSLKNSSAMLKSSLSIILIAFVFAFY